MKNFLRLSFLFLFILSITPQLRAQPGENQAPAPDALLSAVDNDRFYFYTLHARQKYLEILSGNVQFLKTFVNKRGFKSEGGKKLLAFDDFLRTRSQRKSELDSLILSSEKALDQLLSTKQELKSLIDNTPAKEFTSARYKSLLLRAENTERLIQKANADLKQLQTELATVLKETEGMLTTDQRIQKAWRNRLTVAATLPNSPFEIEQELNAFSEITQDYTGLSRMVQQRSADVSAAVSVDDLERDIEVNQKLSSEIKALLERIGRRKTSAEVDISQLRFKQRPQLGSQRDRVPEGSDPFSVLYEDYQKDEGPLKLVNLDDFGYNGGKSGKFHTFKTKAEYDRFAEFARFKNEANTLRSFRNAAIKTDDLKLVLSLLSYELATATKVYQSEDYLTSAMLLEDIYSSYGTVFINRSQKDDVGDLGFNLKLDDVLFILAESHFGARYYHKARETYLTLINDYPESDFVPKSLYRLFYIDYQADNFDRLQNSIESYLLVPIVFEKIRESNRSIRLIRDKVLELESQRFNLEYEFSALGILKQDLVEFLKENQNLDNAIVNEVNRDIASADEESRKVSEKILNTNTRIDSIKLEISRRRTVLNNDIRQKIDISTMNDYGKIFALVSLAMYRDKQYSKAQDYIDMIFEESYSRKLADFLQGMIALNLNDQKLAEFHFRKCLQRLEDLSEPTGRKRKIEMTDIDDQVLEASALMQLGNIHYSRGTKLSLDIDELNRKTEDKRATADSLLQIDLMRLTSGNQFLEYQNQIRRILSKVNSQDTLLARLRDELEGELLANSMSEERLSQMIQSGQLSLTEISQMQEKLDLLFDELSLTKEEGREVGRYLRKLQDLVTRTKEKLFNAKYTVYRNLVTAEFAKAELYFSKISDKNSSKDLGQLGYIWSLFRQGNVKEAEKLLNTYTDTYLRSNKHYQAAFLKGYIKQSLRPNDPVSTLPDYSYVFNASLVYKYHEKLQSSKTRLSQLRSQLNTQIISLRDIAQRDALLKMYQKCDELIFELGFEVDILTKNGNSFFNESKRAKLLNTLSELSLEVNSGNIPTDVKAILSEIVSVSKQMLDYKLEPFGDSQNALSEYPQVAFDAYRSDYNSQADYLKGLLRKEVESLEAEYSKLSQAQVGANSSNQSVLDEFNLDELSLSRDKSVVLNTILYEKQFFGTKTSEIAGTTAIYALSGLTYSEIKRQGEMINGYEQVLSSFKSAIRRKISQIEDFQEIQEEDPLPEFLQAELQFEPKQKEFENIIGDFRKAFFIGTEDLKLSNPKKSKKVEVP